MSPLLGLLWHEIGPFRRRNFVFQPFCEMIYCAFPSRNPPFQERKGRSHLDELHLLQVSLVYINTLMIQRVLSESAWADRMTADDKRGLTPLVWGHVNPYVLFRLDMN